MDAARTRATYADVLAAPPDKIAQVIDGELFVLPRPAMRHSMAASTLGADILNLFGRGRGGGPGGWIVIDEPEVHLHDDILVPDIGAWRRARLPAVPDAAYITLAPDWVCEVLSLSTRRLDRMKKLPVYAREGVSHVWLIDPEAKTVEVFRLQDDRYLLVGTWGGEDRVRLEPFDAAELELAALWADVEESDAAMR